MTPIRSLVVALGLTLVSPAWAVDVYVNACPDPDPAGGLDCYTGWWFYKGTGFQGSATLASLAPGRHSIGADGSFAFVLNADGTVVSENPVAATGGVGTLTLHSGELVVDPGLYSGIWSVLPLVDPATGPRTLSALKAVPMRIWMGKFYGPDVHTVQLDAAGNATLSSGMADEAVVAGNRVTFLNTDIFVDTDGAIGPWRA